MKLAEMLTDARIVCEHPLNHEIRALLVPSGPHNTNPILEIRLQRCGNGIPSATARIADSDDQFNLEFPSPGVASFDLLWSVLGGAP